MLLDAYGYFTPSMETLSSSIVCMFLAVIAAIVVYIIFIPEKNESKYKGFLLWLHKALNFRMMFSLRFLKFLYLLSVCFLTFYGIYMLFNNFVAGLVILTLGNLVNRVVYEFLVLFFSMHDNVSKISTNTSYLNPARNASNTNNSEQTDNPQ